MRLTSPVCRKAMAGVGLGLMLLLVSAAASAAPLDSNVMDSVLAKYQAAATAWGSVMIGYASWLFWGLVLLSMVWTYGMMALKNAGMQEFFAETIRFFAVTGFFWWILYNGPAIADAIVKSMWMIGAKAIGETTSFTPGGVTQIGFDIFFRTLHASSVWSPVDSACGIILSAVILVVLALVGVNLLLLFVTSWVLIYGGVFFLGFGGSRWTSDIAIQYYKTVLSIGAQLMTTLLLIGIGKSVVDQYYANMSNSAKLGELGVLLIVSLVLLWLVEKVPPMIGGIVGGGGIGGIGAGAAMGAAMGAAAMAAGAAGAVAASATGAAGGASALKAAFQGAQASMGGGGGGSSAGGGGADSGSVPSGGGGKGGGGKASPVSGGSSSFRAAMGTGARLAAGTGVNLAKGAGGHIKDKATARISETTGGKIAAAIRAQNAPKADSGNPNAGGSNTNSTSGSLGAGEV